MRRSRKGTFPFVYFIYVCLLLFAFLISVIYVNSVIKEYEETHPDALIEKCIKIMQRDAEDGTLLEKVVFPEDTSDRFESGDIIKDRYADLIRSEEIKYSKTDEDVEKGTRTYNIHVYGINIAEIELKLIRKELKMMDFISIEEYEVTKVKPLFTKNDYTLKVPTGFIVNVNGTMLTSDDGAVSDVAYTNYTVSGLYLPPELEISNAAGKIAEYTIKNGKITADLSEFEVKEYSYTLTLPSTLEVKVNGEVSDGELLSDGRIKHEIKTYSKPDVKISDAFGNTVKYEGGDSIPLTYKTVTAFDSFTVKVDGENIPSELVTDVSSDEFDSLAPFVESLPVLKKYDIAILKSDAEILITDSNNNEIAANPESDNIVLSDIVGLDSIPEDIASEVDVLTIAESWSLFMSNDLSFNELTRYLIPGSFQYDVANKYNSSIDKTFMSVHTLLDPPFRDEKVTNFVKVSDYSFSVDISFAKYMLLSGGIEQVDEMNDRFYFVKYSASGTPDVDGQWKLVGMKEVVNNAE